MNTHTLICKGLHGIKLISYISFLLMANLLPQNLVA